MNETLAVIKKRRSIRKYKPEQIGDKELETIMEAAIYAPSAMNQQKWHFTVIQNREILAKLAKKAAENMLKSPIPFFVERARDPNFNVFHEAPTVVIITGDEKAGFVDLDCGMAAQNITLSAESLKINSCVMGFPSAIFEGDDADAIKKELGIPAGYRFVISVALGYRDMETPPAPPKNRENINYIK
jgi:nitroreductase